MIAQRKLTALTREQQKLVEEALPTAQAIIRRAVEKKGIRSKSTLDDVAQTVGEVLCRTATRYDGRRPTGFVNFAWKAMFGAVAELIGSLRVVHPRALEIAMEGAESIEDTSSDPFLVVDEDDLRELEHGAEDFVFDLHVIDTIEDARRPPDAAVEVQDERTRAFEELEAARDLLDAEERRAIQARFWEGATITEIVTEMGVSESTVKRLIVSAREKLKVTLIARGVHEAPSEDT